MTEWFVIKDLDAFIDSTRVLVFINFGSHESINNIISIDQLSKEDLNELNTVLSYNETMNIAKTYMTKQKNTKSKQIRYIISEKKYANMISGLNERLISNLMVQLVNKGLVETAFDDETNDFIFWVKDNVKNQENPETD